MPSQVFLCDFKVKDFDKSFGSIENYDRLAFVTIRTEIGEMNIVKGYKKRFMVVMTGHTFQLLEPLVSVFIFGEGLDKARVESMLGELEELVNSDAYLGSGFTLGDFVVEKLSSGEASSVIKSIIDSFVNVPCNEMEVREVSLVDKYLNFDEEAEETVKMAGVLIEKGGTLMHFISLPEDGKLYF